MKPVAHVPPIVEFTLRAAKAAKDRIQPETGGVTERAEARNAHAPVAKEQLKAVLAQLSIYPGDLLMVHSDMRAITRLGWEAAGLLDFLLEYLGPRGTLAMPTHPRLKHDGGLRIYDVNRSPSSVGLLTEIFRRRKETLRSEYPFSAAGAQGPLARALTASHRHSYAPHDEHSPYGKLAELEGKVLALGCPLDRMTILHVPEDTMRDEFPIRGFYQPEQVKVKNNGEEFALETHRRSSWLWWYLAKYQWTAQMNALGFVRKASLQGAGFQAMQAKPPVQWMQRRIESGKTIYPLAAWNRVLRLKHAVHDGI
ncbi:MAG: AAC(3) family N-acetyltransferase [Rhodomicrobium sp.]